MRCLWCYDNYLFFRDKNAEELEAYYKKKFAETSDRWVLFLICRSREFTLFAFNQCFVFLYSVMTCVCVLSWKFWGEFGSQWLLELTTLCNTLFLRVHLNQNEYYFGWLLLLKNYFLGGVGHFFGGESGKIHYTDCVLSTDIETTMNCDQKFNNRVSYQVSSKILICLWALFDSFDIFRWAFSIWFSFFHSCHSSTETQTCGLWNARWVLAATSE